MDIETFNQFFEKSYEVSLDQLRTKNRSRYLSEKRLAYGYLCVECLIGYRDAAKEIGRDRTTVIYYRKVIDKCLKVNDKWAIKLIEKFKM